MKKAFTYLAIIIVTSIPIYAQTPVLIKDLNPSGIAEPHRFTPMGSKLYFVADGGTGMELWVTDGTISGTSLVKEINPNGGAFGFIGTADAMRIAVLNNTLYFLADDGVNGAELWKSDGTSAGTVMVKDIQSGASGQDIGYSFIITYKGAVYFRADDGTNGAQLWKTDGTTSGTVAVTNINTSGDFITQNARAIIFKDELYFSGNDGSQFNGKLYKSDGTTNGTVLVHSVGPTFYDAVIFNDELYFSGIDDGLQNSELWKTDGTTSGTVLVAEINTSTDVGSNKIGSYPGSMAVFNSSLFFVAAPVAYTQKLYKTDGTSGGTVLVKDGFTYNGFVGDLTVYNNAIYFGATDAANGTELWKSDGTTGGTALFKDINPDGASYVYDLFIYNGKLYFTADDGTNGTELWETNGTLAGTKMTADINTSGDAFPRYFKIFNNTLYFGALSSTTDFELYKLTTTTTGTFTPVTNFINFKAYPNPTVENITVDLSEHKNASSIRICNMVGEEVKLVDVNEGETSVVIEMKELKSGIYYVIINGYTLTTAKVVKE